MIIKPGININKNNIKPGIIKDPYFTGNLKGLSFKKALETDTITFTSCKKATDTKILGSFGPANLHIKEKTHILELHGSFKDMGLQYGHLQKDRIESFYNDIIKTYTENGFVNNFDKFIMSSMKRLNTYPKDMINFITGISEGSGIPLYKIAVINSLMELIETGCSCVVSKKEFSKSGSTIMGRNFDYPSFFSEFNKYLDVIVLNPENTNNSVMMLTYTGQISGPQAFNSAGLALEINNGIINDRKNGYNDPVNIIKPLLDNTDLDSLVEDLKKIKAESPIIFNVIDQNKSHSLEFTRNDVKQRSGSIKGLLVSTNNFINSGWKTALAKLRNDDTYSTLRRKNLIELAVKSKHNIDANEMMKILDTPFNKGGATFPYGTIYQFIYEPEQLKLFVKSSGYQEWNEIDLKKYIKAN